MQPRLFFLCYFLTNLGLSLALGIKLWRKYDKLRKKINKILNKQKDNEFLINIDDFEYPRTNETLKAIQARLWLEYYECLKLKYAEIGPKKTLYPIALEVLEGKSVTLKCDLCISPLEMRLMDSIEWHFNGSIQGTSNKVLETNEILISPSDRRLIMYNVKSEQIGQYWCKMGDLLSAPYYLFIDSMSESIRIVRPETAPNGPRAAPEITIPEYNLKVYTTWSHWSPCSTCDKVGKKVRYGYCTLSIRESAGPIYVGTESMPGVDVERYKKQVTEDEQPVATSRTNKDNVADKNLNRDLRIILHVFRNKLPCKAKQVPKEIADIASIKNRKTEMMVRYCKKNCPRNVIFEIRDKKGNVLESANNSAGVYSMIQGMPVALPPVIRTTIYKKHKKKVKITCPGNLNTDAPIIWKIGNKVLNQNVIKEQSNGRISIDSRLRIIIKSLRFSDSNIYSCWQKDEIAGIVKLNVTGEVEFKMDHRALIIGAILIICVFLLVFWKAFKGRKRYTIH